MINQGQQFSWRHLSLWHLGVLATVLLAVAGVAYAWCARRSAHWPRRCTVLFFTALAVTFLATQSVIGYFDM